MLLQLLTTLLLSQTAAVAPAPAAVVGPEAAAPTVLVRGWKARAADNLAGLSEPRMLSNPAKVDHSSLMADTAEMKRMKRDRVDPSSAEGVQLKNAAATRVAAACGDAMRQLGHCSVWKAITHVDEREVPDLTEQVRRLL